MESIENTYRKTNIKLLEFKEKDIDITNKISIII